MDSRPHREMPNSYVMVVTLVTLLYLVCSWLRYTADGNIATLCTVQKAQACCFKLKLSGMRELKHTLCFR